MILFDRCYIGDVRQVLRAWVESGVKATGAELAYCAGVIDSDGSISVRRSTYAMRVRGDAGQPIYSERIKVKQVERQAVDLLHRIFAGSFRIETTSLKSGRPFYAWEVTDRRAAVCLTALHPYLRIKQAQAENALRLRGLKMQTAVARVKKGRGQVGCTPRSPEHSEQMQALFLRSKELNSVGI